MAVFTTISRTWVAAEILTASNMNAQLRDFINGFDAWTAYTPTWTASGTAPAIGNGTLSGRYARVNKLVLMSMRFTAGSTTTYGTGSYSFSLPITAVGPLGVPIGGANILDSSASGRYLGTSFIATTTTLQVLTQAAAGVSATVGQTSPMTWASGDDLQISGTYEAA